MRESVQKVARFSRCFDGLCAPLQRWPLEGLSHLLQFIQKVDGVEWLSGRVQKVSPPYSMTVIDTKHYSDRRLGVVVSFASFGENDPSAEGFGQSFLEKNGYAVVAVKKRTDNWYRDLNFDDLQAAVLPVFAQYDARFTYGASMGGYAALYFSACLGARAIAISPRNSVDPRFLAPSYAGYVKQWPTPHQPLTSVADKGAAPIIVFDPLVGSDKIYIEQEVQPAFPSGQYVRFPFSGHPSAEAMLNIGQLKSFVLSALAGKDLPDRILSAGMKGKSAIIINEMSKWAANRGRTVLAHRLSDAAIAKAEGRTDFLYQRGTLLIAAGSVMEACDLTEQTIAIGGGTPTLYHRLATLRAKLGEHETALQAVNAGLELSVRNIGLLRTRRNLLERLGDTERAISDGRAVVAAVPDSNSDRVRLAGLLMTVEAYLEALEHLDVALGSKGDLLALRRRRNCLEALGRQDEAVVAAANVVNLAPDNTGDLNHLVSLCAKAGQIGSAIAWLEEGIERAPDNLAFYRRKRDYLQQVGRLDEAWKVALEIVRRVPDSKLDQARLRSLLLYHYGYAASKRGKRGAFAVLAVRPI